MANVTTICIPYHGKNIEKIHIKGTAHSYWIYRVVRDRDTCSWKDFATEEEAKTYIDKEAEQ